MNTLQLTFKIRGMDCAEEIAALKKELGPTFGEENLRFDLINAKLIISGESVGEMSEEAVKMVARTGMTAIPWDEYTNRENKEGSIWSRYSRSVLLGVGGTCIAGGLAWHAYQHNFVDAVLGAEGDSHSFPSTTFALYVLAILCNGWHIFPKAWFSFRRLRPDMNLLMTVAVVGACLISEWFEAATVTFLFSVALMLESWSIGRARRAIGALMDLSPPTARIMLGDENSFDEVPIEEVNIGTTVLVRPGERIPLDGEVIEGRSAVNQAPITGESQPVYKEIGDEVFAGTINEDGVLKFRVSRLASDTTLAQIIRMVEDAQSRRAQSEQWVERFALYYTPAMMLGALGVAIIPPLLFDGSWSFWFYEALVILVIACPCALVISTPVSIVAGLGAAARAGVLVKGGTYLEAPAHLRAIAMDKTGTLTMGRPEVSEIVPVNGSTREEVLRKAAALEVHSEHPIATAILKMAKAHDVLVPVVSDFQIIKGKGATGTIDGVEHWIGSHRFLHEQEAESGDVHEQAEKLEDAGHTVVAVGHGNDLVGLICIGDTLRSESVAAVRSLKESGIEHVVMLTGDNNGTAKSIAEAVDLDEYQAELLPEDKVNAVRQLRKDWEYVAMIGDGVNDAPAMAEASIGIAMGAIGTDVAIETADIALMTDDLSRLPWLINHSKRVLAIIKQNIIFALGLKVVFIVLTLMGLATLWMAIAADMGASFLVIFNALRLLRN